MTAFGYGTIRVCWLRPSTSLWLVPHEASSCDLCLKAPVKQIKVTTPHSYGHICWKSYNISNLERALGSDMGQNQVLTVRIWRCGCSRRDAQPMFWSCGSSAAPPGDTTDTLHPQLPGSKGEGQVDGFPSKFCVLFVVLRKKRLWLSWHPWWERVGKTLDHVITPWGEECWVKLSKIVILCYYVSIFYLINYCKNI